MQVREYTKGSMYYGEKQLNRKGGKRSMSGWDCESGSCDLKAERSH